MTIRAHILDLKERRAAYANMLQAMLTGKLTSIDDGDVQLTELRRKIAALDLLIAGRAEDP